VVVLDPGLMGLLVVSLGQKVVGTLLINSSLTREVLNIPNGRRTVLGDATAIALRRGLGSATAPIVNTAILGAFARACPEVTIDSIVESIKVSVPAKREQNVAAAQDAYKQLEGL